MNDGSTSTANFHNRLIVHLNDGSILCGRNQIQRFPPGCETFGTVGHRAMTGQGTQEGKPHRCRALCGMPKDRGRDSVPVCQNSPSKKREVSGNVPQSGCQELSLPRWCRHRQNSPATGPRMRISRGRRSHCCCVADPIPCEGNS